MAKKDKIALIGFMGTYKSSVGKMLSDRMDLPLHDTNELVSRWAGMPAAAFYQLRGEEAFRKLEGEAVREALEQPGPAVVALGGGAVMDAQARLLIHQRCRVVWLQAMAATLMDRLSGQAPNIMLPLPVAPAAMDRLMHRLLPHYQSLADLTVSTDGMTSSQVANAVLAKLGSHEQMVYTPLLMRREQLDNVPDAPFPGGYSLRLYRQGDAAAWARIEAAAGEFPSEAAALAHFEAYFEPHAGELARRLYFLTDAAGEAVGTVMAWYWGGQGRIHWVGIVPAHRGRKLCRPMVAQALRTLRELGHERAVLTTQPESYIAIGVYASLGFAPVREDTEENQLGWRQVEQALGRRL